MAERRTISPDSSKGTDAQAVSARKTRHIGRYLLALSALFFLGLVALHFAFKTGALTGIILSVLNSSLEEAGVENLDARSIKINIFNAVELENLELSWRDKEQGNADVKLDGLFLRFDSGSLLSGLLEINELSIPGLMVNAKLNIPPTSDPVTEPDSGELDIKSLETLLANPPINVSLDKLVFRNIKIDVVLEDDSQHISYAGAVQSVEQKLIWNENGLEGRLLLAMEAGDNTGLEYRYQSGNEVVDTRLQPSLNTEFEWQLSREGEQWRLNVPKVHLDFQLADLILKQANQVQIGKLNSFGVKFDGSLQTEQQSHTDGLLSVFPLKTNIEVSQWLDNLEVNKLSIDDLYLDTALKENVSVNLKGLLHPFAEPKPSLEIVIAQEAVVSRLDLRIADDRLQLKGLNSKTNITANNQDGQEAGPVNFTLSTETKLQTLTALMPSQQMELKFAPQLYVTASGHLDSYSDFLNKLTFKLSPQFKASDLEISFLDKTDPQVIRINDTEFISEVTLDEGKLQANGKLSLVRAVLPELKKKINLSVPFSVDTNVDLEQVDGQLGLQINNDSLFELGVAVENRPGKLELSHKVYISHLDKLRAYTDILQDLEILGLPEFTISGETQLQHGADNIQSADFDKIDDMKISTQGSVGIKQVKKPVAADAIHLKDGLDLRYMVKKEQNISASVDVISAGIKTAPLQDYLPFAMHVTENIDWPFTRAITEMGLNLDGKSLLDLSNTLVNNNGRLEMDTRLRVRGYRSWRRFIAEIAELDAIGDVETNVAIKASVKHKRATVLDLTDEDIKTASADATINVEIKQLEAGDKALVQLEEPVSLLTQVILNDQEAMLTTRFSVGRTRVDDLLELNYMRGDTAIRVKNVFSPETVDFAFNLNPSDFSLIDQDTKIHISDFVTPAKVVLNMQQLGEQYLINDFSSVIGKEYLTTNVTGQVDSNFENAQLRVDTKVKLFPAMLDAPALSGAGDIEFPLNITFFGGKDVSVEGKLVFNDVYLNLDELAVHRLNGSLKIEEELSIDDGILHYKYIDIVDPFQRVDYSLIKPFVNDDSLSLEKLTYDEISVGPLHAQSAIKQNLLRFPDFSLKLFDGFITGQFFLDTRPGDWKLGLLSRLSDVDPRFLLSKESELKNAKRSPVNVRTALVFDFNRRLLEGKVDVSDINSQQLLQLLEMIDPEHKDEQLGLLRKALRSAYPEWVSLDMSQGLLDLRVKVSLLAKVIEIKRIPLTSLIQQYAGDMLDEIRDIPLQ